jgi:hypothetical protein
MPRALAKSLRSSQALLVLDNASTCWMSGQRSQTCYSGSVGASNVLATIGEPLGIPAEVSRDVPSLAAPAPHLSDSVAEMEGSPAVHFFVDRASALQPDFSLDADNAHAIAQMCRRLDGIPQALELAGSSERECVGARNSSRPISSVTRSSVRCGRACGAIRAGAVLGRGRGYQPDVSRRTPGRVHRIARRRSTTHFGGCRARRRRHLRRPASAPRRSGGQ